MKMNMSAKCSDLFSADLIDDNGQIVKEYNGYVPKFFPGQHWGDYVQLNIDLKTGQILNWVPPTEEQLAEFIGGEED